MTPWLQLNYWILTKLSQLILSYTWSSHCCTGQQDHATQSTD